MDAIQKSSLLFPISTDTPSRTAGSSLKILRNTLFSLPDSHAHTIR